MTSSLQRVVVRWPNWVGDAVMATPVLRELDRALPQAGVWIVGRRSARVMLAGFPGIAGWIEYRDAEHGGLRGAWRLARSLARHRFDAALILPNSFASALAPFLARIPRRLGYHLEHRSLLLTDGLRPAMEGRRRRPEPMTRYYLALTARLTGEPGASHRGDERVELRVTEDEEERARPLLRSLGLETGERYAAVNPGASFGPSKLWTPHAFSDVVRGLHRELSLRSLVLCGPGEEGLAADISRRAGAAAIDTSSALIPLDLLKPVLRDCEVLVTTDTGPRHIAVAFDTPVVVVMGATDPRYTASNLHCTEVLRIEVDCSPCHKKVCSERTHRCMEGIEPSWVLEAAKSLLKRRTSPSSR
ncbi:MAG: lipopolysaccharide heptosyltransferase II [Planctomycetota bacterium]